MINSPCYDASKRTDCKLRTINCRSTCHAWKRYEKEKEAEYKQRTKQYKEQESQIGYDRMVSQRIERRKHMK